MTTPTSVIFAKNPHAVDDGCDHTALIIWRMNANARARTCSTYVPMPVPVQVMPAKFSKAATGKKVTRKKAKKVDFPARDLVAVMIGKTMTYQAILTALDTQHPGHGITVRKLQTRITSMFKSPHAQITRHETPVPEFSLTHVDERFYAKSAQTFEAMA